MKRKSTTAYLVQAAFVAAVYAALTYFLEPISFSSAQLRVSEALTILPVLTPAAIPGLTIGCIISNLASPYGIVDIICGSVATFFAAICTRATRNIRFKKLPVASAIFPVLFNGIIVGGEISFMSTDGFSLPVFAVTALSVASGEAIVCFVAGLLLNSALEHTKIFERNR